MKSLNRSSLIALLITLSLGASLLTACGGRGASLQVTAKPPATAIRQATAAPPATLAPQLATAAPQSTVPQPTALSTTTVSTIAPSATVVPAAATASPDTSGDALEQLLQKLDTANSASDNLGDVPEIK